MHRLAQIVWDYRPLALAAGGLMWLIWCVSSILGAGVLDLNEQVIGTDHTAFHAAAMMLADGEGAALYDFPQLTEFARYQAEFTGKPGFLDPFRNPPYYAIPYLATARLPYLASFAIWALVGLLCLTGGLMLVRGKRIGRPLLWSLSFYPIFATVSFGQNTLLSFATFALVYRCLLSERRFLAGLASGLLLFKPQLLLGLGVWWLLDCRRLWPCLAGLSTAGVLIALLSLVLLPTETAEWLRRLPDIARYDEFEFYNLHNPRGFGYLLTGSKGVGNIAGLLGLGLAIAWLVRFSQRFRRDRSLMFVAAMLATLWGSPHTMTYEWALAVLPAIILWYQRPERREEWGWLFGLAWIALFISTPVTKGQWAIMGIAVQLSVPVLAWIVLAIERSLLRGP
jgi:alpha-1,2-mannosyltransferase